MEELYEDFDYSDVMDFERNEDEQEGCSCGSQCMDCLGMSWSDFL